MTDDRSNLPPHRFASLIHGLTHPPRSSSQPAEPEPEPGPPTRPSHPRIQARGTRRDPVLTPGILPGDQIRTLIFANEPTRAAWIEGELSRAPISITIQVGRKVRTVVSALVRDPEPRPQVLIVDFDAVTPGELLELHAIREEGWFGRLIGLGTVTQELIDSLGIDHIFAPPLVRDSLLDCVAGTRHAAVTVAIPLGPLRGDVK